MDYSKLSNEDLLALKAGDYSKVSNEGLLALKGGPASPPQDKRGMIQKGRDVLDVGRAAIKTLGNEGVPMLGAPGGVQDLADRGGAAIAEGALGGDSHPVARGMAAGVVANAPDLALGAEGLRQAGSAGIRQWQRVKNFFQRPSPRELRTAMQVELKTLGTPATDAVKAQARAALPPAQEKQRLAKAAQEKVAEGYRQLEGKAQAKLKAAKGNLDVVEENLDLKVPFSSPKFQKIVKSPGAMARYTTEADKLAQKGPIELSKTLKPQRIQLMRKVLQEGRRTMAGGARAQLENARETFGRALEYGDDYFKEARVGFQKAKNLVDQLPLRKTKMAERAKQAVGEAGRELQELQQKFRALTEEAATADKARATKIQIERLRVIAQAEAFETKLQRNLKLAWAAMGAAGVTGLGYKLRQEMKP